MLQQTTTTAVVPYFERFTERFPDVQALAQAAQEDVLRCWEGLGYYSRARNLHAAARMIVDELNGQIPDTRSELLQLPGIGRYTASAIASFAYGRNAGIVEANTVRLYSRLLEISSPPTSSRAQKALWQFADWVVPETGAADFNQALMDIGATVCRPVNPDCQACPVAACCGAFKSGRQAEIPMAKSRQPITDVVEVCLALQRRGQVLLRQCGEGQRWSGLWDFPRFELTDSDWSGGRERTCSTDPWIPAQKIAHQDLARIHATVGEGILLATGFASGPLDLAMQFRHTVTRYRIRRVCVVANVSSGRMRRDQNLRWHSLGELNDLPLTAPGRRFASQLASQ